jgi:hypothetical protein
LGGRGRRSKLRRGGRGCGGSRRRRGAAVSPRASASVGADRAGAPGRHPRARGALMHTFMWICLFAPSLSSSCTRTHKRARCKTSTQTHFHAHTNANNKKGGSRSCKR